ncbi:hypothetical protein [Methylocystis rosea]|uniref:hypothetical protein n=1 Tax=Methylocystis rosea TaxID=173366 RepID=UPI0012EB1615|nr:hypothetical protein [Methylocystis rosea]
MAPIKSLNQIGLSPKENIGTTIAPALQKRLSARHSPSKGMPAFFNKRVEGLPSGSIMQAARAPSRSAAQRSFDDHLFPGHETP